MGTDETTAVVPGVVLGVAAHPDDLDFGAAATLAHWAKQGSSIYYLIVTDGSKGSADPQATSGQLIQVRRQEQLAAAKIVGAADVFFLDYEDSMLELTNNLKRDITRYIRRLKPDVVITMDPTFIYSESNNFINHSDHRVVGQATLDAVYPLARDRLTFPELLDEGLAPHKTRIILLTNFDRHDCYIDVSETIDKKLAALAAHTSQMPNLEDTQARIKQLASRLGEEAGYAYAEAFLRIDIDA